MDAMFTIKDEENVGWEMLTEKGEDWLKRQSVPDLKVAMF